MQNTRRKTLFKYVIPSILSNTCIFLFTIVDGVFVGRGVGSDALGAVNIAMPVVMIATAINMLTSIGGCAIAAIRLGQNDKEGANQAFLHSLTANVVLAAIITLVCTLLTEPLSKFLGADAFYLPMVKEYVFWWGLFAIPSALSVNFQFFCRNDGSPALVAVATVISTVLNIFLDWLFVFPMQMGIMGAAIATGISQTVSWLIVAIHFILRKGDLRIRLYKPQMGMFGQIIFFGLPEMIAQFATPVTTICLNTVIVAHLGEVGVNAFAVISYVASLAISVFAGAAPVRADLRCQGRKGYEVVLPQRYAYQLCRQYRNSGTVYSLWQTDLRTVRRRYRNTGVHSAISAAVCVGVYCGRTEHHDLGVSVLHRAFGLRDPAQYLPRTGL